MSGKRKIDVPKQRVAANPEKVLKLTGARGNNLKDVTLTPPVGLFTRVTGVSGSGKSTLINDTLFPIAQTQLNGATLRNPRRIARFRDWNISIRLLISTKARLVVRRALTQQPIRVCLRRYVNCFAGVPESRSRGIRQDVSVLTCAADAARPVRAMALLKSRCNSPDIYVPCDQCSAITAKPLRSNTKAKQSTKCWI